MRGQRGGGVEPAADDQPEVAQDLQVGGRLTVDAQLQQRVDQAGPRILPDLHHGVDHVDAHLPVHLGDARGVGRVLRGGHREVRGLAVDRPLLQLDAHHRQREHRGHDVGEVVDEVDSAGLDLLVEGGAHDLVDERLPPLDRGGGEVRVQRAAVGAVLGLVHLQDAAAHDGGPLAFGIVMPW